MIRIKAVETYVYRYPLEAPVQTSFGTMNDRPMVIVKLVDQDNVSGLARYGVIIQRLVLSTEQRLSKVS